MIERLWGYHDYVSMSPAMLTDKLATIALESSTHARLLERTRRILQRQYPMVRDWLSARSDIFSHIPPRAGAIAWFGLKKRWDSAVMAEDLRAQKGVLLVPGEQLGMESYLRIGFGGNAALLRQALARIDDWIAESAAGAAT